MKPILPLLASTLLATASSRPARRRLVAAPRPRVRPPPPTGRSPATGSASTASPSAATRHPPGASPSTAPPGWHARVVFWQRSDGRWRRRFTAADGRIGYGGLVRRRAAGAGLRQDPARHLPAALGVRDAPAARHLGPLATARCAAATTGSSTTSRATTTATATSGRAASAGGSGPATPTPPSGSRTSRVQYEWAIITSFNSRQVRHRGGAIFLHVNGSGATAGCVSAPRWFLEEADAPPRPATGRRCRGREVSRWPRRGSGSTSRAARSR